MDRPLEGRVVSDAPAPALGCIDGCAVTQGMPVIGADGVQVGRLKDMNALSILAPLAARCVRAADGDPGVLHTRIVLTLPAAEVDDRDWPRPNLLS